MILSAAADSDIQKWGHALLYDHPALNTFEDAANLICHRAFETFLLQDQSPLFALFRVFRIGYHAELPPELRPQYKDPKEHLIMLTGTCGVEPAWRDRRRSVGLQVVPMPIAMMRPMFVEAFRQMHIEWGSSAHPDLQGAARGLVHYFHVPQARKSPWVVDQESFVIPYGIQSTIGIGTTFLSKSAFIAIGFSRAPITTEDAQKFSLITPYVSTLLASFDHQPYWNE